VDAMGGTLRVKSEPGAGTTFSLYLPMTEGAGSIAASASVSGSKVLVVNDSATTRCIVDHYLTASGATVQGLGDARAALASLREAANASAPFTAVLIDGKLPEMDGLELVRQIRADAAICGVRCVMMTAAGQTDSMESPIDGWLHKPMRRRELLASIQASVSSPSQPAPVNSAVARTDMPLFASARVLIVEDNDVNQMVARRLLKTFGIEARVVSDGAQAVDAVRSEAWDLIFMDCQMPVMDGYEATRAIRTFSRVPIVAMTANALIGDREKCLAAGMDDFISKPVRKELVADALVRWLPATSRVEEARRA
jgi:two-component system, sensor histidine kinase and response regulator